MSAGIGGRTIEEAKERMSYAEAQSWSAYVQKHGPLNLGIRMELGFAMLALKIDSALGGKRTLKDFMPWASYTSADEDEGEATLQDIMGILTGAMR